MPRLVRVLEMVLAQKTAWPIEVMVVDSGSTDGTVEFVRAHRSVRLLTIPAADFGHGRTRNWAISQSDAPFVAFLTHDAQPCDVHWLASLVAAVEQDDRVAGAFGQHLAWDNADPFTKRDLKQHFDQFLAHPLVVSRHTDPEGYDTSEQWRQFLHYYSDNNSCMRRQVWERHPYPDVDFAEDQLWADQIIRAGYSKAYAPDARVYHSHDFGPIEKLQRSFDESMSFASSFGYRLAPSFSLALRSLCGLLLRDITFAWNATAPIRPLATTLAKRLASDAMLVTGHFLGSHHEVIPSALRKTLSRDKRLSAS